MQITITDRQRTRLSGYLKPRIAKAAAIIKAPVKELSIALVGDREMSDLHWQFMKVKGPTDVLTFELEHDRQNRVTAGEIIICVPEAKRKHKESGRASTGVRNEILLYSIHGLLHLCGYDDRTSCAFDLMHRTEDMILTKLGVGPVFSAGEARRTAQPTQRRSKGVSR